MYYIYIDEAGRWPLAWPVQVGLIFEQINKKQSVWDMADTFPARNIAWYNNCKDSKILSESQRDALYDTITSNKNIFYATAKISATDIDRRWIVWWLRHGIMRAMHAHFVGSKFTQWELQSWIIWQKHEVVLVIDWPSDFWLRKALWITVITVVDWDDKVPMISAASIIAKVERDAYMVRADKRYPQYGFAQHKWYWTKLHYEMIEKYWLCKEHRKSYIHEME